jgi:SAM-dependent methyltransferase
MTNALEIKKSYEQQRDEFVERILRSTAGTFEMFSIFIGERLGYYRALANAGALTAEELAVYTGTQLRYTREWLEQQSVTGILEHNIENGVVRFQIHEAHAEVLVDQDSLNYLAPLSLAIAGAVRPLEKLLKAYRYGGGVSYTEYGQNFLDGQAGINRAMFLKQLGAEWLPSIPDIHQKLQNSKPALVADFGCGAGWSSIGIALHYPNVIVEGYDLDVPSIEMARANAEAYGVADRVKFYVRDAGDNELSGKYDLVTAFECLHDMSNPVAALEVMRKLAGPEGAVIVADERVGESFTGEWGDVDWIMYGWSILHCLPVGMADEPSAGTGTVMRYETVRNFAQKAGFRDVQILPIDNYFLRFYRMVS